MSYRTAVITCSDRAIADIREDRAGPLLRQALDDLGLVVSRPVVVPLVADEIRQAIESSIDDGARIVLTTGGTGLGPRDIIAQVTSQLLTTEIPGLQEEVRRRGAVREPRALLSRGLAGVIIRPSRPPSLIVNAPSSSGGARDTVAVIGSMLEYIIGQLDGDSRC